MNRHRVISISSILILGLVLPALPSGAAIKAGAVCKKAQQVRVVKGDSFTCVRKGKRLVWRKSGVAPVVVPAAEPTPTASPSPTPTVSPTPEPTPTPTATSSTPSDSLSHKNTMIYGIRGTELIRRADSGVFFEEDSRPSTAFSEVRRKAFQELNKSPDLIDHPNVELIFDVTDSFPKEIAAFIKVEIAKAATLWNDYFDDVVKVNVSLVTEKDREHIKNNRYMQINLPGIFDRFDRRNERPFVSGGGAFWHFDKEWAGHIYLSTASWVDTNYMNFEWPQVARHEFVHVVQDYAHFKNFKSLGLPRDRDEKFQNELQPRHFREGGADTIGYLTSFRNIGWASDALDWLFWNRARITRSSFKIGNESEAIRVMKETECAGFCRSNNGSNPEQAFELSYGLGAIMYEWVIAEYGFSGYLKMLDQMMIAKSFDDVVMNALGMKKDDFYKAVAPYVLEVANRIDAYQD